MQDIVKIKFDGPQTIIHQNSYTTGREKDTVNKITDPRHPDFEVAMQAFTIEVIRMLSLDTKYEEGMSITGLSLSCNETQGEGVVITAQKSLPGIASPLVINTPHVHEDLSATGQSCMSRTMQDKISDVVKEAGLFLDGKSAQLNLLEDKAA